MKMNGGSTQKKKLRSSNLKTNPQLLGFVKPSFIVNKKKKKSMVFNSYYCQRPSFKSNCYHLDLILKNMRILVGANNEDILNYTV